MEKKSPRLRMLRVEIEYFVFPKPADSNIYINCCTVNLAIFLFFCLFLPFTVITTSKYLDDTVMIIKSCELLGVFWTDKPLK